MSDMSLTKQSEPVIDLSRLEPAELERAKTLAQDINIEEAQAVVQFGVGAQVKISGFADTILNEVRSKDTGYVGESLSDLVVSIKGVGVDKMTSDYGSSKFLSKFKKRIKKFMAQYDKISVQIEKIVDELDKARMGLIKDITMLDQLYDKNVEYLEDLDIYIAAGQLKLNEIHQTVIPEYKKKAETSNDPVDAQKFQDLLQAVNRFEKKLHDLKLSRMVAIQTGPQIRLIQNGDQVLVEKIQSSILNTIPLWKNQIIIAISLFNQKKALEVQREVTDTTNELLAKNSEMLKQGTIEVAQESERGIVEIETLKKVNENLISTIEETIKIQKEGREKRQAAETELRAMEQELKDKLVQSSPSES